MFIKRMQFIGLSLAINVAVCLTILPLVVPPFRFYTLPELGEVVLWQGMGAIGWPFVILGAILALIFYTSATNLAALFIMLLYPSIFLLLVSSLIIKEPQRWQLILLHLCITLSFVATWYQVLNGYDFMIG
jgi:hypothetical protein